MAVNRLLLRQVCLPIPPLRRNLVHLIGVEPTPGFPDWVLGPARLPVPPQVLFRNFSDIRGLYSTFCNPGPTHSF